MKLIYQIGRFARDFMEMREFNFKDKSYKELLSSFAIKRAFEEEGFQTETAKVVLIYPTSLLLNETVIDWLLKDKKGNQYRELNEFKEKISGITSNALEEYLLSPYDFFRMHPYSKIAEDFLVIYSIGEYKLFGKPIKFNCSYDDIVLQIFSDMAIRYLNEYNKDNGAIEFYIDISSGQNMYISALLEAVRHFSVFSGLLNWLKKEKRPKIFLAFSDPILSELEKTYKIHIEELRFKTFFSSPIKKKEIEDFNLARRMANGEKECSGRCNFVFKKFFGNVKAKTFKVME